jgi:hypothetical protein
MTRSRNAEKIRSGRRRGRLLTAMLALAALPVGAGTASAFIVNFVPAINKIPAPPSVLPGALTGTDIKAFDERQDVLLTAPLLVDHQGPGLVTTPGDLNPAWIPPGTCVRSHYLHFDPATNGVVANGALQFAGDVVGVIARPATLDASNFLGAFATTYPPNAGAGICAVAGATCGLELTTPTQDSFQIVGPDVLRVGVTAGNPGDRIRVITKSCGCDPKPQ